MGEYQIPQELSEKFRAELDQLLVGFDFYLISCFHVR